MRKIFGGIGLCPPKPSDYRLFNSIIRVARNNEVSPYHADKLFWLVGSGYFYDHKAEIGKEGRIPTKRDEFIKEVRDILR